MILRRTARLTEPRSKARSDRGRPAARFAVDDTRLTRREQVTENFARMTDQQWATRFQTGGIRPAEVPWVAPVLAQ